MLISIIYMNRNIYIQIYLDYLNHSVIRICISKAHIIKKTINLRIDVRVIYRVDHRSYDRAKPHMIGQNLVAYLVDIVA